MARLIAAFLLFPLIAHAEVRLDVSISDGPGPSLTLSLDEHAARVSRFHAGDGGAIGVFRMPTGPTELTRLARLAEAAKSTPVQVDCRR